MPDSPVWDPAKWQRNYIESIQPGKVLKALKPKIERVRERGLAAQAELDWLQRAVTKICYNHGVMLELVPHYVAYAEEVHFRARQFEWDTDRRREHKLLRVKWEKRGLDPALLDEIDKVVPLGKGRVYIPP